MKLKLLAVMLTALAAGMAQGIGADHPHLVGLYGAQPLAKTAQTCQGHTLTGRTQPLVCIQSAAQTDHLAQPVDGGQLPMIKTGKQHVKAV